MKTVGSCCAEPSLGFEWELVPTSDVVTRRRFMSARASARNSTRYRASTLGEACLKEQPEHMRRIQADYLLVP